MGRTTDEPPVRSSLDTSPLGPVERERRSRIGWNPSGRPRPPVLRLVPGRHVGSGAVPAYDRHRPAILEALADSMRITAARLARRKGVRIVEIGAPTPLAWAREYVDRLTSPEWIPSIDLVFVDLRFKDDAADGLAILERHYDELPLRACLLERCATQVDHGLGRVDLALSIQLLSCLDPASLRAHFAAVACVLRPPTRSRSGGAYVAITELRDRVTDKVRWQGTTVFAYSLPQLEAAARAAGLRILGKSTRRAHAGPPRDRQRMLAIILERRDERGRDRLPRRNGKP